MSLEKANPAAAQLRPERTALVLIDLQERLRASNGKPKRPFTAPVADETLAAKVKELASARLAEAMIVLGRDAGRLQAAKQASLARVARDFAG